MVIDEINRANVPKVFGELLSCSSTERNRYGASTGPTMRLSCPRTCCSSGR